MRTLEEVIETAPYIGTEWTNDALYYLKEYQELTAELVELNKPLTWDELKTMEGKPVWVEYDDHLPGRKRTKFKVWEVIDYVSDDRFIANNDWTYDKDEMGDVWQAYRKERS